MGVGGFKALLVEAAVGQVEFIDRHLLKSQRQIQGRRVARSAIALDQRPQHPRLALDKAATILVDEPQPLQRGQIPAVVCVPQLADCGDALFGQLARLAVVAEAGQRVERVEALAQVVRTKGSVPRLWSRG